MKLDHLCFVLPPESTELGPKPARYRAQKPLEAPKNHDQGCGKQVAILVHDLLSKVIGKTRHNRHQSAAAFVDAEGVQLFDKVGKENPRIFSFAELYIGTRGFGEDELLGSGGFGKVYRAVLPGDGSVAAVKILAEKGERFEKSFEAELAAVAHLRHRNLVRLLGWCTHEDRLLLVYDYMPNRSLDRVLFRRTEKTAEAVETTLSWETRRKIIGGLAAGLHYLHENLETQIIHRDVKTSNVMLDSDFNARLGDFGLARWIEHELKLELSHANTTVAVVSSNDHRFRVTDTTRIGGTIGYLPPESFQRGIVATAKSDVFSFGIVVLEVASGRRAVDLAYPDDRIVLLDWVWGLSDEGKMVEAVDKRLRPGSFRGSEMERVIHLGLLCTIQNPISRPSMKWVVEAISGNFSGKLPGLPSFRSHPLYIAFSSSDSNPSTTDTSTTSSSLNTASTRSNAAVTVSSSRYFSANGDTVFATAHDHEEEKANTTTTAMKQRRLSAFFTVETPREIPYKELVAATGNFSEMRKVAELDFGAAYHGRLRDRDVLVKKLGMSKCPALVARFSDELRNLGQLRHRNLVQLRGWCTEFGEMLVVYDYWTTHLLSHHTNPKPNLNRALLTWHQRYNIVKSLGAAVLYLHEEWEEQVIHRNITSSTVTLDSDMNPRLTGFALAEFLTRNDHAHNAAVKSVRGVFGYMSPEYIVSGEAATAADIYSFGVVVLEVVTGTTAVDFRRKEVLLVRRAIESEITDLVDSRLNGEYNYGEMVRLVKLGIACTRSDPDSRPSIRQIVSILDGNDRCFEETPTECIEEWKRRNAASLSMIRSMQALGIQ